MLSITYCIYFLNISCCHGDMSTLLWNNIAKKGYKTKTWTKREYLFKSNKTQPLSTKYSKKMSNSTFVPKNCNLSHFIMHETF